MMYQEFIQIVDFRENSPWFGECIKRSLEMISLSDRRRYERVENQLEWIVNEKVHRGCAEYLHRRSSCSIEFVEPLEEFELGKYNIDRMAGYYASIIVHEATHGKIRCLRNNEGSNPHNILRIEKLCLLEEQRFQTKLEQFDSSLIKVREIYLDENAYSEVFKTKQWEKDIELLKRTIFEKEA